MNKEKDDKRNIPIWLKGILEKDHVLTSYVLQQASKVIDAKEYKSQMKGLEVSCHGIPWLVASLMVFYGFRSNEVKSFAMNLIIGLMLDIVFIALIKAVARRRRPGKETEHSDMFMTHGPDKFSFPSGHCSRAIWLCLFFNNYFQSLILNVLMLPWALSICVSRILLKRHWVLDVSVGVVVGFLEYYLTVPNMIYITKETIAYYYPPLEGIDDTNDDD